MSEKLHNPVTWTIAVMRYPDGGFAIGEVDLKSLSEELRQSVMASIIPLKARGDIDGARLAVGDYVGQWNAELDARIAAERQQELADSPKMPRFIREAEELEEVPAKRSWLRVIGGGR